MTAASALVALLFAFCLDRWWGEPRARWHPVVWMGHYLERLGGRVAPSEAAASTDWRAFRAGALAWWSGAVLVTLLAWLLQAALLRWGGVAAGLLLGALLKPMLAWRMLQEETRAIEDGLAQSPAEARRQLARLVSRDVAQLGETEMRESAIESLAENLNDSVVAPVFWFLLFGLPGAALYRFANTADAMWGYRGLRNGRHWEWAGKWAARADDVLSWVPARITALLLAGVAGGMSLRALRAEASRTPSPNGGWPMAAMALALGVRLRKPGVYVLNAAGRAATSQDSVRAGQLASRAVLAMLLLASLALLLAAQGRA